MSWWHWPCCSENKDCPTCEDEVMAAQWTFDLNTVADNPSWTCVDAPDCTDLNGQYTFTMTDCSGDDNSPYCSSRIDLDPILSCDAISGDTYSYVHLYFTAPGDGNHYIRLSFYPSGSRCSPWNDVNPYYEKTLADPIDCTTTHTLTLQSPFGADGPYCLFPSTIDLEPVT